MQKPYSDSGILRYFKQYLERDALDIVDNYQQASGKSDFHWSDQLIRCCRNGLQSLEKQTGKTQSYYKFSDETSKLLKKCFREVEDMKAKSMAANNGAWERTSKKLRFHK